MSRTLVTLATALGAALLAPSAAAGVAPADRPNVVVVMTDDQDFRSMAALPQTRRLLARRGTTFATSVASLPLCCPSRATFLTGQYAHNHDVRWNHWPLGGYRKLRQRETLPVWLQRAGYRTIHVGKYLNQTGEERPTEVPRGWTEWHGGVDPTTYGYYGMTINHDGRLRTYRRTPRNYATDVYARIAVRAIRRAARAGEPFFLNVAPNAPHTDSVASNAELEGLPAVPAPRHADVFADAPLPRHPSFDEADVSDKPPNLAAVLPPLTDDQIAALTEHYRGRMGALLAVDDLVARVMAELERQGVAGETDVIFTSDNGWMLGQHRMRDPVTQDGRAAGVKYFPFEDSSRVPLLAAGPDFPRGRVVDGVVANVDLAPTILDVTGARAGLPQDGRSLVRAARRPATLDGRGVLLEGFENPRGATPYASIRTRRYRLDVQPDGTRGLYDLRRDPWELRSRHDDPAYAEIEAILERGLERLRDCRGRACRVDVGPLPQPGA